MKVRATRSLLVLGLVVLLVVVFAYMMVPRNVAKEMQDKASIADKKRFTPNESVDIAMAMKLITHEPPKMLNPPNEMPPLLLYPPSEEELSRLSGQ